MALTYSRHAGDASGLYVAPFRKGEGNPGFEESSSPSQQDLHCGTREGNIGKLAFGMHSSQQDDIAPRLRRNVHRTKRDETTAPQIMPDTSIFGSLSPSQGADALQLKWDCK